MTYALCECLDENAAKLQGPAVIFTEEELRSTRMAIESQLYSLLVPFKEDRILAGVSAKLNYIINREKPSCG